MDTPLSDDEFRLFSEWLAQEYGLRFGPEKREILRARLEPRRAALSLDSFERLLFRVRYHPDRERERRLLVSALTNNESYFFREPNQLDLLREHLPALGREAGRAGRPVRILSAGCASGEEVYTLLIVAREVLGEGADLEVTGVDLDGEALERARTGVYRNHAFRSIEDSVRRQHFEPADRDRFRIRPRLRAAARFQQGNLMDPAWPDSVPPQDVVFCRNVLIYFDGDAQRRAAENLYRVVRPGGYLFLGHAESLSRIPTRFISERRPGAVFHRRPES
jgi:chemotaxis protein methyltransferase CheR